ncbi:hypothetical protein FE257_008192 [Aspergillus nanangensis]|uniref:Uncharacterized protein n=1 Tax=Aspergillus nanangensis TaxID=2582783 RepID=A0AAD4GUV4_ASPNN|nr:hypothetical protein FE257_008192 [Aspergillus nanangensis]
MSDLSMAAQHQRSTASGIGLEVAKALLARDDPLWQVYILGSNEERGKQAVAHHVPRAIFLHADVRNYTKLANAFHVVYEATKRIDFVFANAGILESCDFLSSLNSREDGVKAHPPKQPDLAVVDVNLSGVINTCYLALYYFRLYRQPDGENKTNLGDGDSFTDVPCDLFIPLEQVVETTLLLLDRSDIVDSRGSQVSASDLWNRTVEISGRNQVYFQERLEPSDGVMERMLTETFLRIKDPILQADTPSHVQE